MQRTRYSNGAAAGPHWGCAGLPKTGGRQKGGVDKIKREAILAAQGITPLDYMLGIIRTQ
jgi:hypothetical protein